MTEQSFLPILIGSDMNAYGMARAFYEAYGVKAIVIGRAHLTPTQNSRILEFQQEPKLKEDFLEIMQRTAKKYAHKDLLLMGCGDDYVKLIIKNKDELVKDFKVPYIDESLMDQILLKENFYEMCEKYNFSYPKTDTVTAANYENFNPDFQYPIIIKASNSVEYWACSFPGKKKVFVANDEAEKTAILKAIYASSYQDTMIIQEFIPGDDSYMRVLNAYVATDGKVKLMCLGNPILEEHTPEGIGSYAAIITTFDQELMDQVGHFLEDIGFEGIANFDMKYDYRDGKYKLFEINLRNGRSSYYVTAAGYNLMQYVADDYMLGKKQEKVYGDNEHLWSVIPHGVLFKYAENKELKAKARKLIKEGKVTNSLFYKEDMNIKRWVKLTLNSLNYYRKYKKYFNKKGLS